jgi:hypothetical protein
VLSLAAFMISVGLFIPDGLHNTGLAVLVAIASLAIVYFLWQLFVIGRTEWTISDDEISILWTRKFPLAAVDNFNIKWTDIQNISRGLDSNYYVLKIELNTGQKIRFIHDPLTTRDDFRECLAVLYETFNLKKQHPKTA